MIRNQWYVILESNEIKKGKIVGVTRMGEKMVAWRNAAGALSVMSDLCPHRGVALSVGYLEADCIVCPFHGFAYDTKGACTLVPANGKKAEPPKALKARSYEVREQHGWVYIWWGEPRDEYPPVPWFEAIPDDMPYSTIKDPWANHYARAIENQLDAVHLPFIHRTTIGRGNRTIVNGPLVQEENCWPEDHLLNLWVQNEVDHGQKPLRASEIPTPERHPSLQFRYPNVWHNWIADGIRAAIAFVPVDDEHTLMYIRYYHTMRVPVLREIFGWIGGQMNLVIERQDRWVVVTQRPPRPDLGIGEILIPGDGPIVTYRKLRRQLIEAAETGLPNPK